MDDRRSERRGVKRCRSAQPDIPFLILQSRACRRAGGAPSGRQPKKWRNANASATLGRDRREAYVSVERRRRYVAEFAWRRNVGEADAIGERRRRSPAVGNRPMYRDLTA